MQYVGAMFKKIPFVLHYIDNDVVASSQHRCLHVRLLTHPFI